MRLRNSQPETEFSDEEEWEEESDDLDDYGFQDYDGSPPVQRQQELLRKLTDFDPYLRQMVAEWLGMIWDDSKGEYTSEKGLEPRMNIRGARWAVNFLRTYTRDNNILTRIGEDTYANMMTDVSETVLLNIGTRAEKFGINNDGDVLSISNQIIHATELVLAGAHGNQTYSDTIMTTTHRNENVAVSDGPQPQQAQLRQPSKNPLKRMMGWMR